MKRLITQLSVILAAVALAVGCTEKYPSPDHYVGVIAGDFTRTAYTAEGNMLKGSWTEGDEISVNGNLCAAAAAGRSSDFYVLSGPMAPDRNAGPFTAWYPAEIARHELPNVQAYQASGPFEVPMMATSPTMYLEFKPICGLLEIRLSTQLENIEVSMLELVADKPLSGAFTLDETGKAVLGGPAENGILMECEPAVPLGTEPVSFWVSLPEGEYGNLTIHMTAADGRTQDFVLAEGQKAPVRCGRITACPIVMESILPQEGDTAYLPAGQEFNIALKRIANQNPNLADNAIETTTTDSSIIRIDFVKGDPNASGVPLGGSDIPVYGSFNAETGVMTVSTTAPHLHMATDCYGMFRYMAALETMSFEGLESDGLADISYIFNHCHNLKTVDLTALNTSEVRTMDNAFSYAQQLQVPDLSHFDTHNVRCMRSLFNHCTSFKELDLRSFKTEQCTIMTYMFYYCTSLEKLDISSFDLQNVSGSNLTYHFFATPALKEVRTSDKYIPNDKGTPSNYCTGSGTSKSLRMGSINNGVTFYTTQAVADWLATTNLRWIKSGYNGKGAIPVYFLDSSTGTELSVTWAAN